MIQTLGRIEFRGKNNCVIYDNAAIYDVRYHGLTFLKKIDFIDFNLVSSGS